MGKPIPLLVISAGDEQDYVVFDYTMAEKQLSDLLIEPESMDLIGRGFYLKVPLSQLDRLLYRARRVCTYPLIRLQRSDVDLGILYLEDFISYWNTRISESQNT